MISIEYLIANFFLSTSRARRLAITAAIAGYVLLSANCGISGDAVSTGPVSLTISPSSLQVPMGLTGSLQATAIYADGTSRDVTNQVAWTVTPEIGTVSPDGYLRSISPGNATVSASLDSVSANVSLQILPPTLESVVHQPIKDEYIWFGPPAAEGEVRFLRSEFEVGSNPQKATLYIAGPRQATAFLNGNQVIAAAEQRPTWQVADMGAVADVSSVLRPGTNVLAIETVGGSQLAAKIVPAGQGIAADSIVEGGAGWRGSTMAAQGWQGTTFDDQSWAAVSVIGGMEENPLNFEGNTDMELYQWPGYDGISPWLAHTSVPVKAVLSTSGNIVQNFYRARGTSEFTVQMSSGGAPPSMTLDFGDEFNGKLMLVSQTAAQVTVQTKYGESLDELDTNPYLGVQTIVIPANGTASGPKSGYRYAQVTFTAGPPVIKLANLYSDKIYYPVPHLGSFYSSDELLNQIWQLAEKTIQVGMQEHIWDAPKRDRLPYSGDGYVIGQAIGHTFADRFLLEQTIERLATAAGASDVNGIPGYDAMWILMLADYYERYGDRSYLQAESGFLKSLLATMESEIGSDGLFHFPSDTYPFFDWSQNLQPPPVTEGASIGTHFEFILGFQQGAWLLQELGDATTGHYSQLASQLQESAREFFLDPATNTYGPYWQINAMAILAGTATPDQILSIWDSVLSQPSQFWVTPFLNYFVLNAMTAAGHSQDALNLVRNYWGGMVNEGANCFWEGYDPSWPKDHFHLYLHADDVEGTFVSLCHGWGAGPISWLNTQIAGIQPLAPGFSSVIIRPDLCDLTYLNVEEPTPLGMISLSATAPQFSATVGLPAGMIAELSVPVSAGQRSVIVNGRPTRGTPAEGGTRLVINLTGGTQYSVSVR